MSVDGVFHDAHEVQVKSSLTDPWTWVATCQTKALATRVSELEVFAGVFVQLVPV